MLSSLSCIALKWQPAPTQCILFSVVGELTPIIYKTGIETLRRRCAPTPDEAGRGSRPISSITAKRIAQRLSNAGHVCALNRAIALAPPGGGRARFALLSPIRKSDVMA